MTQRLAWRVGATLLTFLLLSALMSMVPPRLRELTAPGQRAHSLARAELPGGDLALVAVPAAAGRAGVVALWWAGREDDQVRWLGYLPGYPAQERH